MRTTLLLTQVVLFSLIFPAVVWAVDTDGDGVPDGTDVCCHTPVGVTVDAAGRPKGDLDNDCDVDQSDFAIFQANMTGPITQCTPGPEVCDGLDNNCNCLIDDGANTSCPNVTNGTGLCQTGACTFSCNTGFGNCDGNAANGCELNTNTSVNNCGSCGHVCSAQNHAGPTCAGGTCGVFCIGPWKNCDGDPSNGCEIPVASPCP